MKLLWNLDNTVAISFKAIDSFKIIGGDNEWRVQAWHNGTYHNVFISNTKAECINFIDKMEECL